jgi:hypothetical protein
LFTVSTATMEDSFVERGSKRGERLPSLTLFFGHGRTRLVTRQEGMKRILPDGRKRRQYYSFVYQKSRPSSKTS